MTALGTDVTLVHASGRDGSVHDPGRDAEERLHERVAE
jgi:hypothetical protein